MNKISIRFFDDTEVRAVWDDEHSKWWFSVLDIVGVLRGESQYEKNRNYWKYLKAKLKKENCELVSRANQLKLTAADGRQLIWRSDWRSRAIAFWRSTLILKLPCLRFMVSSPNLI